MLITIFPIAGSPFGLVLSAATDADTATPETGRPGPAQFAPAGVCIRVEVPQGPDLRHDPLRHQRAPIVRAAAIAPEPIASFRTVDVRGSETPPGRRAGTASGTLLFPCSRSQASSWTRRCVSFPGPGPVMAETAVL